MIKRINFGSFIYQTFYLHNKCQTVAKTISTSAVCHIKKERNDILNLKKELTELERNRYENTFGDIESFESKFARIKEDPEDILEYKRAKAAPGKSVRQYINEIKSLLQNNDYKSAVKLLEVDMRNDKIHNTSFIYKILLCHNGIVGNLEEAYRLFIDFKRRQGIVTGAMYTSMFNACANCKNSFLALEKANAIRDCLSRNKFHTVNISNYNAMLKAYGRHGDIPTCLKIMDEVLERRENVKVETYSFLLQACISDKNSGLRHALLVWRKMLQNRVKPSIYSFNLMLRCIRDCSLGEVLLIPKVIEQVLEESKYFYKRKIKVKTIGTTVKHTLLKIPADGSGLITPVGNKSESQEQTKNDFINIGNVETNETKLLSDGVKKETFENLMVECKSHSNNAEIKNDSFESSLSEVEGEKLGDGQNIKSLNSMNLPNLLALEPTTGSVVEFGRMANSQERFMLVGGLEGFLKTMAEFQVKPDIKTFTLLLSVIPLNIEAEEKLMSLAESYGINLDTGFFNVLIKRRIFRSDNHLVEDILKQMYARNLKPDILTFGILAMNCETHESAIELLKNIRLHGFRVNSPIIDSLVRQAGITRDMKYLLTAIRAAKEDDVELDPKCLAGISRIVEQEKFRKRSEKENYYDKKLLDENDIELQNVKSKNIEGLSTQV